MRRAHPRWIFVCLAALPAATSALADESLSVPFEKYTLSNGLDVILHEDHAVPIVAVDLWYHVGSKNEKPGRTGFAHLFEHMMFQGTPHFEGEYFAPIEEAGGQVNGSTSEDRTNYWEVVPSNYLELALAMESDRMGYLPDAMTQDKLDNQRDVVQNERRQSVDNQPYGASDELLLGLLFPEGHPYSWSVIGSMADLEAASLEDVTEFFRTYYTPNNASLCIAGDFDPAEVKGMIERYFGTIPPGPPVERMTAWSPRFDGVRRAEAEDDVELPRVYMAWNSPAMFAPGDAEMDILSFVLGDGITSRLERSLVYEAQIAQDVYVMQESRSLGSIFQIVVTAREGVSLEEIEAAVDAELSKFLKDGITRNELDEAKTNLESHLVRGIMSVGGFGGRADMLNRYNVLLGDPGKIEWDADRYRDTTVESVNLWARRVLDLNGRAIVRIVPEMGLEVADVEADRDRAPVATADPTFTPPAIQEADLSNGMKLLLVEDHRLPLVDLQVVINRGWASDPADRFGAGAITLDMIDDGTKSMDALEIAGAFRALGTDLRLNGSFDASALQVNVLTKSFDPALDLLAQLIQEPTFPQEELDRQKQLYLGRILQERARPVTAALKTFMTMIYGEGHPYSQPYTGSGTEETIAAITRDDLVRFHDAHWHPNVATVIVTGDMTLSEARKKIESAFRNWKPGDSPEPATPAPPAANTRIVIVDKPGAPQSVVVAGNLTLARTDPDYDRFSVLNMVLGGQFTSRLNLNLREDKGYTYGSYSFIWGAKIEEPLLAYAQVQSEYTVLSVTEIVNELTDIAGRRPPSEEELAYMKGSMLKGMPGDFESMRNISRQLFNVAKYDLPLDSWTREVDAIRGTTVDDLVRLGKEYVRPDRLLIVVVGDRAKIESDLRGLGLGEVSVYRGAGAGKRATGGSPDASRPSGARS